MMKILQKFNLQNITTRKILTAIFLAHAGSFIASILALILYVSPYFTPDATLHMAGRHDVGYRVFYMDNGIFDNGSMPNNRHYLMSFTDYWEFESYFSTHFSQVLDIAYNYSVTSTLAIRHIRGNNSSISPIVHDVKSTLAEGSGSVTGDSINLSNGIFTIDPRGYIDAYFEFVAKQQAQMYRENIITDRATHFSAELAVMFIYQIRSAGGEVNETFTRGYTIPLTTEVYYFSSTGMGTFERSITLRAFTMPSLFTMIVLVLWFVGLIYGVFSSLQKLTQDSNTYRRELKRILSRYGDEIATAQEPAELSEYKTVTFASFAELLKLAVNMGRQIICSHTDTKADFWVIADGCVFCFSLNNDSASE